MIVRALKQSEGRNIEETQEKARVLLEALPYLKQFAGRTVVVKIGGELVDDENRARRLAEDVVLLKSVGINVVLCHGGGPQISRAMKRFGKEPCFINGQRVTDAETVEIVSMVLLGDINRKLVSMLNGHGPRAVGVSGIDGQLFLVHQKSPELGYVGDIEAVSAGPVRQLIDSGFIPVVASLGVDGAGQVFNINADIAAGKLARALKAEKLVVLTNVPGLYECFGDEDTLISEVETRSLQKMLTSGALTEGMIPKVEAVVTAINGGVAKAHILDGRVEHALLLEIFTPEGIGTMVTPPKH
ncbi:MAG: acetylglutamate kinase [Bdellovibrionales bacterium]|nr:acetylglutamate kinase [Bdellovibrionales bacterium]